MTISEAQLIALPTDLPIEGEIVTPTPFSQEMVLISKQDLIAMRHKIGSLEAQLAKVRGKLDERDKELLLKEAHIKDLQNQLFGKKTEKVASSSKSNTTPPSARKRGQQEGTSGHGPTPRPNLTVTPETADLPEDQKKCPKCGLPHVCREALDEVSEVIEVIVKAHVRHIHRPAYAPNEGCCCSEVPGIIIAPPPVTLLPRSPFGVSFWVEIIISKFLFAQSTHRCLQNLNDLGLPVSPGTVAGGLKAIAPLFTPIMEALYVRQMSEQLFHNDETRWPVFVKIEGKIGTRWYLWVSRSFSVIFYNIDPSRSAAVPGAHFAGLQGDRAIIVCDRYGAYKKLARLSDVILLAFCWAHVRRDFLDAGRTIAGLEDWGLEWKERIATLYHLNALRLEHWQPDLPLEEQSVEFQSQQQALKESLQSVHDEATRLAKPDANKKGDDSSKKKTKESLSKDVAREEQRKISQSLLNHWAGLILFLTHPEVPMDNNLGENAIRDPAMGRKNYYGSGSIWSAELAAALFSILQTLELWGIPQRRWLTSYFQACAENGGKAPSNIEPFLPWSMADAPRSKQSKPPPARPPPVVAQKEA